MTKLVLAFELFEDGQEAVNSFFPGRAVKRFDILNFVRHNDAVHLNWGVVPPTLRRIRGRVRAASLRAPVKIEWLPRLLKTVYWLGDSGSAATSIAGRRSSHLAGAPIWHWHHAVVSGFSRLSALHADSTHGEY